MNLKYMFILSTLALISFSTTANAKYYKLTTAVMDVYEVPSGSDQLNCESKNSKFFLIANATKKNLRRVTYVRHCKWDLIKDNCDGLLAPELPYLQDKVYSETSQELEISGFKNSADCEYKKRAVRATGYVKNETHSSEKFKFDTIDMLISFLRK